MQRAVGFVLSLRLATAFPQVPKSVGILLDAMRQHGADLLEVTMTITPGELLDTSIAQLQILVAFLSDRLGETGVRPDLESDATEVRACREVLLSLSALIIYRHWLARLLLRDDLAAEHRSSAEKWTMREAQVLKGPKRNCK